MSKPATRSVHLEQAALATYLGELGFETMVLPEGLPSPAVQSESARVVPRGIERRPTSPSQRAGSQEDARGRTGGRGDQDSAVVTAPVKFEIVDDLTSEQRFARLAEVGQHSSACTGCKLSQKRNSVVFGSGDGNADLMLIGEGPGAREDQQGEPFVGPAGELLTKMLSAIEMERSTVYIANVVKCRPPGNRDPRPEEVIACSGYLEAQIKLIRPRVILALGRVAAQALLACQTPLGRLRNQWHTYHGVPVWVTYHPAALLRNSTYKRPAWEDLQVVRDRILKGSQDT